jgi:pyruvate formate lyase activating enzyme
VLVTNGFICREPLERLLEFIDAVNIDVKSFNPLFYKEIGGALDDVKRTVEIAVSRCHVELTALIIPRKNDYNYSVEEMKSLSEWIADIDADIPLHISRFFPAYEMRGTSPTPVETIYKLAETARQNLRYVYHGNC